MAFKTTQLFDTVTGLQVADLSSTNKIVGNWIYVGVGSNVALTFAWPATGTPVGTCGVEFSNDPNCEGSTSAHRAVTGDALDLTTLVPTPVQPAGTASRMPLRFDSGGVYLRPTYLATSGGTGATMTITVGAAGLGVQREFSV